MSNFFKRRGVSDASERTPEPFGTLLCVRHESSGGSMVNRSEFEIELTDREIVQCAYWPQDTAQPMVRREHIPVTQAQWADVAQTVKTLWPLFRPVKPEPPVQEIPGIHMLDGGDYSRWYLTRQTTDGVCTVQYSQPDDRRIRTLIELMRELAEPIGRKIPRYDPPVLCGVYYENEKAKCSFQCTAWSGTEDVYRLIVYGITSGDARVPISVWNEVRAFLEPLHLDRLRRAERDDTVKCTLYFTDGKQKRVAPDRKTANRMQSFFARISDRVLQENHHKGE